ncbi:AlbA family DNA-binding domain-containing protein [Blastococcus sp. SYSU DS1021]
MALNIDVHEGLRRPADLVKLAEAVVAGKDEDEADWVEWKSTLDLTTPEGAFSLARQILGSANRHPDHAARYMAGLGYVLVGVEPGSVEGVTPIDLAKLDAALEKYLGNPGPVWAGIFVEVQGKDVLVVTVEAPRWGDRFYPLAKTFQGEKGKPGADAGTVFVRRQARTLPAGPGEIQMLQDRLLRGQQPEQSLDLDVEWPVDPAVLTTLNVSSDALKEWISQRREAVLAMEPPPEEPLPQGTARMQAAMARAIRADPRSREKYEQEVEDHLQKCWKAVHQAVLREVLAQQLNLIELRVTNPTVRNLPDVELTVRIEGRVLAYDEDEDTKWSLPRPPKAYGTPDMSGLFGGLSPDAPGLSLPLSRLIASSPAVSLKSLHIDIDNGPPVTTITLQLGDIRPHGVANATPFMLVVAEEPGSMVTLKWSATSTRVDARQEGELVVPVADHARTPLDLIPYEID